MARPRKPTALKILHGDFVKNPQRKNPLEPQVESAIPKCPKSITGEAKKEWTRITKELHSIGVITQVDRAALEQYVAIWAEWLACKELVEEEGRILASESGQYEHPANRMVCRYADQIHKYLVQFGLTPAARTRVNVVKQTEPLRMRRQR